MKANAQSSASIPAAAVPEYREVHVTGDYTTVLTSQDDYNSNIVIVTDESDRGSQDARVPMSNMLQRNLHQRQDQFNRHKK